MELEEQSTTSTTKREWIEERWEQTKSLRIHQGSLASMALVPSIGDQRMIITGGNDGLVTLVHL